MNEEMLPHISRLSSTKLHQILSPVKGVIFDIDGTLTKPGVINFKRLRERAKIPPGKDIFPYIKATYKGDDYVEAMKIVEEEELIGQNNTSLQPGADELLHFLNSMDIKVGLLTRNSKLCMNQTIKLFSSRIDKAYCRDIQPSKPHIDPFVRISAEWNIPCDKLLLVGDHVDDFIPALAISSKSCYVRPDTCTTNSSTNHLSSDSYGNGLSLENCQQLPSYIEEYKKTHCYYIPDIVVDNISELYEAWYNTPCIK